MKFHVGTSGYSYKEWKGSFYPEKLPAKDFLKFYGERFSTVEINNTFYRMPAESMLAQWSQSVGDHFTFTLKAPRRITHDKRLREAEADVAEFVRRAGGVLRWRLTLHGQLTGSNRGLVKNPLAAFVSTAITAATAGQPYVYQAQAIDPDGFGAPLAMAANGKTVGFVP